MNYLIGGLLGDFINCLAVPKLNFDVTGKKSNIYIDCVKNEKFKTGLEQTYKDLKPILLAQPYINIFSIYKKEHIDINMLHFRKPLKQYRKKCSYWLEFLFHFYCKNIKPTKEFKWLYSAEKNKKFKDVVIIHRPYYRQITKCSKERYEDIINNNNTVFLCHDLRDYNEFPLKNKIEVLHLSNLINIINVIDSCKQFIGNQSAYYCIANSLNINRGIEVNRPTCWRMYEREYLYYKNTFKFG